MIEKLSEYKITRRDGAFINVECNTKIINTLVRKINELADVVNELQTTNTHIQNDLHEMRHSKTKTCRMDKEFAEEELDRTRKALDVAVDALKSAQQYICSDKKSYQIIQTAIEQITALEQKDVK